MHYYLLTPFIKVHLAEIRSATRFKIELCSSSSILGKSGDPKSILKSQGKL